MVLSSIPHAIIETFAMCFVISGLYKLNKTIIIVLHDINFASCYSDNIIALKQGEIVKADVKDNVIQSDILKKLYEMDVRIEEIRGQRICLYYDEATFDSV